MPLAVQDLAPLLLVLGFGCAARSNHWLRGVTYRAAPLSLSQDKVAKACFYLAVLGLLDVVLRRGLSALRPKLPVVLRVLLLCAPAAGWLSLGPLHPATSTRDDSGFRESAQRWRLWDLMCRYMFGGRCQIVLSEEWRSLSPAQVKRWTEDHTKPYVIPMHPHGLLPLGGIINGLTWYGGSMRGITASGAEDVPKPAAPGTGLHQAFFPHMRLRAAVASGVFWVPGFFEMYSKLGCIECTKPFMRDLLRRGRSVAVYPGGAAESRFARPGRYVCYVKRRKGFVRLALEERVDLLPLYTFGDEAIAPQAAWKDEDPDSAILPVQRVLKEVFGLLLPPLPAGLPRFDPLTTVVGLPVSFEDLWPAEADGEITEEMVDKAHERYMQAQKRTFDQNKALVPGGHADAEIEFL
mmetsp:Transcript_49948/g.142779  ORF Transcript_49948/g.142779 Transcript_49948/m.142779 type:complete len:408 (-) Transcript_49948:108-1331(-)